jgi:anhydro-N-acetylmuramic acid kinase
MAQLLKKDSFLAAGLMSGTSMDGIDIALVRLGAGDDLSTVVLLGFHMVPYPDELRSSLKEMAFGEPCSAENVATMHTSVAVAFANAFLTACRKSDVSGEDVDFIGSHGQTVAHVPPSGDGMNLIAGTLQLGPPGMIAALTGVMTVGDFRGADIALGGQGAPLAPYADFLLRRSKDEDRVILNIGGIANITYLPKNCALGEVIAFDTGPGNMVIDELYRVLFPKEVGYDNLNEHAARGKPAHALVEEFLGFSFFDEEPPKSAGHREFGGRFAWEFLSKAEAKGLTREDALASAVTLTTRTIYNAIHAHVVPKGNVDKVYVTGGGAHNNTMMDELRGLLDPIGIASIDELGVPGDAKEAVDFAVLARGTILSQTNVIHQVTGASRPTILGTIALGGAA